MVVLDKYGLSFYSEELEAHCKIDASKAIEHIEEIRNILKELIHFLP